MAKTNKVKFGLSNVHYAPLNTAADGTVSFGTPVPLPGAVNLSLSPQGDTNTFYADDVAYYVTAANSGYQGDLELALIPDDFAADILKEALDETAKVLVENSQAESSAFALLFEFKGDQHRIKHVLYNCTAARPNVAGATTTNTKEPATATLSLTASPLADGRVKAKTTAETPEAIANAWYNQVWQPASSS